MLISKLKSVILVAAAVLSFSTNANAITQTSIVDDRHTNNQIVCLAQNAYFEARNQPLAGKIAVMNVVMNRTADLRFPSTPCGVIYQRSGRTCQFSWVCSKRDINDTKSYSELKDLASKVYTRQIGDVTNGAKFFHHTGVSPRWNHKVTKVIVSHIFYR